MNKGEAPQGSDWASKKYLANKPELPEKILVKSLIGLNELIDDGQIGEAVERMCRILEKNFQRFDTLIDHAKWMEEQTGAIMSNYQTMCEGGPHKPQECSPTKGVGLKSIVHPGSLEEVEIDLPESCNNCGAWMDTGDGGNCLEAVKHPDEKMEGRTALNNWCKYWQPKHCCEAFRMLSVDNNVHRQGCQCFLRVGNWQMHLVYCPLCGKKL